MSDQNEQTIDWTTVRPGDPDVTPEGCHPTDDSPCVCGPVCDVILASEQAAAMLGSGVPVQIVQMLAGPIAFCNRPEHADDPEGTAIHVAADGKRVVCVWHGGIDGEPAVIRWAPDLGIDDVG